MPQDHSVPEPVYVALAARPHRAGVFVADVDGIPWQAMFRGAIAAMTRVWGGTQSVLVPRGAYPPVGDDHATSELFWELVRLADADWWGVYTGSLAELETLDPERFEHVHAQVTGAAGVEPIELTRKRDRAEALDEPLINVPIPPDLADLLVARAAPLHHEGRLPSRGPLTGGPVPWPLVDVLAFRDHPTGLHPPALVGDPTLDLLLAAEFGAVSAATRDARRGLVMAELEPKSHAEALSWAYGDRPSNVTLPNQLAEYGLTWFSPLIIAETTVTLVVGDSPWDFALAHLLRRARTHAFWHPGFERWTEREQAAALQRAADHAVRLGVPLVVTTASDADAAATAAGHPQLTTKRSLVIRTVPWQEALPPRGNRLLADDTLAAPEPYYVHGGATPMLPTPIPRTRTHDVTQLRWMTDVDADTWSAARHPRLGEQLIMGADARVAANGVTYSSPHWAVMSAVPIEYQVRRPRLRPLDVLEQIQALAGSGGWRCEPSDKGRFAQGAADLFEGYLGLCRALRDPDTAQLLAIYQDAGADAPGLALKDRRRYPSLADLAQRKWEGKLDDLVVGLEERAVLVRGLVLKCGNCRQTDFYRPADADPAFTCTRCGTRSRLTRGAWMVGAEPPWRYRLAEVIFQFVRHRGDLPALVVFERFSRSPQVVDAIVEVEILDSHATKSELDFVVVDGPDLWLGEAFSERRYGSTRRKEGERFARLHEIATVLNARGVILATAAPELAQPTIDAARRRFPGPWPQLELCTAAFALDRPAKPIDAPDDR